MNDDGFLFSSPTLIGEIHEHLQYERHQCFGWTAMKNCEFKQLPSACYLSSKLLQQPITKRALLYNQLHEMIDLKLFDKYDNGIVITFERWPRTFINKDKTYSD
jgi:hypothetical protein